MAEMPGTSSEIQVGELLSKVDGGERELLLLDVRNQDEFDTWRIEGRRPVETIHIPYFDFIEEAEASVARVPKGRDLVVLCAKGGSSEMVVDMLKDAGLPAKNVRGGMIAYGDFLDPLRVSLPAASDAPFELWQVNRRGKGCLAYVVVSGGEAAVVDPSRHVAWYEDFAKSRGARVVHVLDTHVHADHVSGGPELARRAGATYFVAAGEGFDLKTDVRPLADGAEISIGRGVRLRVISTPGHTPGSTSFLVGGKALLSGDTLFVSSVGRPDLGGHVEEWGEDLYRTLHARLADLPDDVVVLPAHFGGPHDIGADGVVSGRLGDLRRSVPEMMLSGARAFVAAMRAAVKTPPEAYAHIIQTNLGVEHAEADKILEWELGKNQCAVHPAAAQA
jgi:glyoxylase-like metal-dependent hydrolase (beta-lactamase superfamily II)/rhodanese-related sulfurtransferase